MSLAEAEHVRSVRMDRPYSVVTVDIDNLKGINDTFGHEAGNKALRLVADSIVRITRSEDIVARFGGDEFVVCMPGHDRDIAYEVAQRVRNVVYASTLEVEAQMVRVTVSVGVSSYSADGRKLEAVLQASDRSMYQDKDLRRVPKDQLVVEKS
jgi:diguanylate cyclase (GGDEF)-like protein